MDKTDFEGSTLGTECLMPEEFNETSAENVIIKVEPADVNPDIEEPESEGTVNVPACGGSRSKHARTVIPKVSYPCTFPGCCCKFYNKKTQEEHIARHITNHFPCEVKGCGRVFYTKSKLVSHTIVHTGEKPYRCIVPSCGKSFAVRSGLNCHMITHTSEKPMKCGYAGCDRTFNIKSKYLQHLATHTGIKRFQCGFEGCGRSFVTKSSMRSHFAIHTGPKMLKCNSLGCGERFCFRWELNEHNDRVHRGGVDNGNVKNLPRVQPTAVVRSLPDGATSFFYKL